VKARILLLALNSLLIFLALAGAATATVQAYACADISGEWLVDETANVDCTSTGPITQSESDVITMNQSGCNISYDRTVGDFTAHRSGIIHDDGSLQMSGKLVIFVPGVTEKENNLTINGTLVNAGLITFTGEGRASGSLGGVTETCTATTSGTLTRDTSDLVVFGVSVSNSRPITDRAFTINATVKNQGKVSTGSTTLRYYRSKDSTITTGDTQIASDAVSNLSPGGSSAESESVSIIPTGTFWFGACVDPVQREAPTTNNCSKGIQVTVMEQISITPTIQLLLDPDE
jgi:hypothetical protein